jgi:hypothetical protein
MSNKRFMLFAGSHYYPSGGMNDYVRSFDTVEQAISNIGGCTYWIARRVKYMIPISVLMVHLAFVHGQRILTLI